MEIEFSTSKMNHLNDLESSVFDWILTNKTAAAKLTVREVADKVHVSTATVIRMTKNMGFRGWSDFRYYLNDKGQEEAVPVNYYENLLRLDLFLKRISNREISRKLEQAVKLIKKAKYIVFVGLGTSGALADYGAKYFSNLGLESYAITDPYQAMKKQNAAAGLTIVLSASGETDKLIERLLILRENSEKILSITNRKNTPISKLSDVNLTYDFQEEYSQYDMLENLTTQLPVVAYLEILAHQAAE
ncbi:MurR/RpiR family transcriptional regulator [Lactovum odontotermitis]